MTVSEAAVLLYESVVDLSHARAERDELHAWLRAALKALIEQSRELDRVREQLRRERQQHADLRARILERQEAA